MLWLLLRSGVTFLNNPAGIQSGEPSAHQKMLSDNQTGKDSAQCCFPQLVLPEIVLALAATTSFHVQVVNRLSSGYPIWLLTLAGWVTSQGDGTGRMRTHWVIRGMIMYCLIQGILFANFLPPA